MEADALVGALDRRGAAVSGRRTREMAAHLAAQEAAGERPVTAAGAVDVETALRHLERVLPERRLHRHGHGRGDRTVHDIGDLEQAAKVTANRRRPLLIDLRLDVHHIRPMAH